MIVLAPGADSATLQKRMDRNRGPFVLTDLFQGKPYESAGTACRTSTPGKKEHIRSFTNNSTVTEEMNPDSSSAEEEVRRLRIQKCSACCASKKQAFLNINLDSRLGEALFEECTAACNSEGQSASTWSDCWEQPDRQ